MKNQSSINTLNQTSSEENHDSENSKPTITIDEKMLTSLMYVGGQTMKKVIKERVPLYSLLGYSKAEMHNLYRQAYNFYQSENYQAAQLLFQQLAFYDQWDKRGWMGLGSCYQMSKHYTNALQMYGFVTAIDEKDPWAYIHMFHCLLELQKYNDALQMIDLLAALIKKDERYKPLTEKINSLRVALKESIAKTSSEEEEED